MPQVSLNRRLQNRIFESWRLGGDFVKSKAQLELPGNLQRGQGNAVDYLHTRTSILRNHLLESQGRHFVATQGSAGTTVVSELSTTPEVAIRQLACKLVRTAAPATDQAPVAVIGAPHPCMLQGKLKHPESCESSETSSVTST
jgi:hypothetical protein